MKLTISDELIKKIPEFNVIAYMMDISVTTTENLTEYLNNAFNQIYQEYQTSDIVNLPKLKETRDGYKKLGKDPSHTRPACEALLRRIIKQSGLYRINDIVDLGNLLSLETMRSVCVVDFDKIVGDITIQIGLDGDTYEGINRGVINAKNLPIYVDQIGIFGSPTSDTMRTAITADTTKILVMIICFSNRDLAMDELKLQILYRKWTNASNIQKMK